MLFIISLMETKLFPCLKSSLKTMKMLILPLNDFAAMLQRAIGKKWRQSPKQRRLESLKYLPVALCPEGTLKQGSVSLVSYWKLEFMKAKCKR